MLCCAGLIALVMLASCAPSTGLMAVSGKVNFDGQPLKDGDIMFIPADKQFGAEAGKIKDGAYQLNTRPGMNRVEIRATRLVPGKLGPMGEPATEPFVPAAYNSASTLTADVGSGKLKHDFELKAE